MRIEFTKNEIGAAKRLAHNIAYEIDKKMAVDILHQDMYEGLPEAPFVTVMENGNVVIDVPEDLVVEYYEISTGYIEQVVNLGKSVYILLKQFKFITKSFEKQLTDMILRYIPKKEEPISEPEQPEA